MKRKRFSAVLGCVLTLAILAGIAIPLASAAEVTIEFLNPLGTVVPPNNQPLVERPTSLDGKTVRFIYYGTATDSTSAVSMGVLGDALKAEYPTMTAVYASLTGSPATMYDAKTAATYDSWAAGADAVVFGIVEDNVGAWWISRHVKEIEARGVPAVVVMNSWWDSAVKCGAEDNGIAAMRSVSVDRHAYADAYGKATAAYTNATSARYTYLSGEFAKPGSIYSKVKSSLTAPLTTVEKSSAPLSPADFGDPGVSSFTVTGANFAAAMQKFKNLSMAMDFGDGLPLDIPTNAAVNSLLAMTDRAPDEILGRIMLRGGLITVEKVAINAVMAGARPEHFPIILAAMEAYATAWEDNKLFYQSTLANGQTTLMMVVSGPAVDELDIGNARAFDLGNEGEGVIGRAVRLCTRNIGHILQQNTTIVEAFYRINDHELYVVGESNEFLPAGWKTHSEMMGFPAGSNTVTLICTTRGQITSGSGAGTATATAFLGSLRTSAASAANNAPGIYAINFTQAAMAARPASTATGGMGLSTKEDVQAYIANNPNNNNRVFPIVAGFGKSMGGRAWNATTTYSSRGFHAQLAPDKGAANLLAPSTPKDFNVEYIGNKTEATLTWAAPDRTGGAIAYQVSEDGGANWIDIGTNLTYKAANLDPDAEYSFFVRAVNSVRNSAGVIQSGAVWGLSYDASGRGAWADPDYVSVRVESLKIGGANNGGAMVSIPRNTKVAFFADVNAGATTDGILWSVSDPTFAIVDQSGNVTTLNKSGMVTLIAKDSVSGIIHAIVLRIT
ncbi:MAG: fibronectin type III domain-containing protein [Oscillospiraceae bacterium]|nr:fibronectin type III domain-containing protein [Oscillospiraceae bacterium]